MGLLITVLCILALIIFSLYDFTMRKLIRQQKKMLEQQNFLIKEQEHIILSLRGE